MFAISERKVNRCVLNNKGATVTGAPIHGWLRPRLRTLVNDADQAGFDRRAVTAVRIDPITGPGFNDPPPYQEPV